VLAPIGPAVVAVPEAAVVVVAVPEAAISDPRLTPLSSLPSA